MSVRTSFSFGHPRTSSDVHSRPHLPTDVVKTASPRTWCIRTDAPPSPPLSLPPCYPRICPDAGFQISVFGFQSPKSPKSPSSPSSAGEAAIRRWFFRPSSSSHPSKLYSSLRWLNSKVPKPFPPFSLRLIDVDGF
jgi:hypothetical protein